MKQRRKVLNFLVVRTQFEKKYLYDETNFYVQILAVVERLLFCVQISIFEMKAKNELNIFSSFQEMLIKSFDIGIILRYSRTTILFVLLKYFFAK